MADELHVLVVYDVVTNRRRAMLAKKLGVFLDRVQLSVFEGRVPPDRLPRLKDTIRRVIDLEKDSVRVYRLCARCVTSVEVVGTSVCVPGPVTDEVI
jgi:CRISPR-associated protein Cas2